MNVEGDIMVCDRCGWKGKPDIFYYSCPLCSSTELRHSFLEHGDFSFVERI